MKLKKLINWIFGIKKEIPYPNDFILIDYSPIAKQNGIMDDQNKIIYRYTFDEFGNIIIKKYKYSKARLKALQEIYKIPFYDKTKQEDRFPVWAKILPSEIEYTKK